MEELNRCGRSRRRPERADHEFGETLGIGEVGILQVEAAGLEGAEQGSDWPAVGIGVDGLGLGGAGGCDEQAVPVVEVSIHELLSCSPIGGQLV